MFPFYALWKHQKTIVFWYFRGVWKRNIEKKKIDLYIAVIVTAVHTHIGTCIILPITGKTFCIELFARLRWCRSFSFSLAFLFFWLSYRKWCARLVLILSVGQNQDFLQKEEYTDTNLSSVALELGMIKKISIIKLTPIHWSLSLQASKTLCQSLIWSKSH